MTDDDVTPFGLRAAWLHAARVVLAALVASLAFLRPDAFSPGTAPPVALVAAMYATVTTGLVVARRHRAPWTHQGVATTVLADVVLLGAALVFSGASGPAAPMAVVYAVAVTLLVSQRGGLFAAIGLAVGDLLAAALVDAATVAAPRQPLGLHPTIVVVTLLAAVAVIAVGTWVDGRSLRHAAGALRVRADLGLRVNAVGQPLEVAMVVADGLRNDLGAHRVVALFWTDDGSEITGVVVDAHTTVGIAVPVAAAAVETGTPTATALTSGRAVLSDRRGDSVDPLLDAVAPWSTHVVVVPLVSDRIPLGLLILDWPATDDSIPAPTVDLLEDVGTHVALVLRQARLLAEVNRLADHDALTGLVNRRVMVDRIETELGRAQRSGDETSLVFLDLDHFKAVNDTKGHAEGDRVLAAVGVVLRSELRAHDVAARWGGEELVVLLPATPIDEATTTADRLRVAIAEATGGVTASAGVASSPGSGGTAGSLLSTADAALYHAKRTGRDRTCVADDRVAVLGPGRTSPRPPGPAITSAAVATDPVPTVA